MEYRYYWVPSSIRDPDPRPTSFRTLKNLKLTLKVWLLARNFCTQKFFYPQLQLPHVFVSYVNLETCLVLWILTSICFIPFSIRPTCKCKTNLFLKIHKHERIISSYVIRKNISDSTLDLFLFTLIFVLCCFCLFMLTLPIPVTPGWPHPFPGLQNGSASFVNGRKLCLVMLALYFL